MECATQHHLGFSLGILGAALSIEVLAVVGAGLLGTIIGSFVNVLVWRVPRELSLVSPGSACPHCGAAIRPWDNVPILSWLVLRGKCRACHAPISVRYPLVEAATGVGFAGVALVAAEDPWSWPAAFYLVTISVALGLIDLETRRLPNKIVLPSYPIAAVLIGVGIALGESTWWDGVRALVGAGLLFALYMVLALVRPGGMGYGDIKLAGVLGLYLGWWGWGALVVGGFAAFLLGGLWGIAMMALGSAGRKSRIPFGPWMLAGALIGFGGGEQLWSAYLSLST